MLEEIIVSCCMLRPVWFPINVRQSEGQMKLHEALKSFNWFTQAQKLLEASFVRHLLVTKSPEFEEIMIFWLFFV